MKLIRSFQVFVGGKAVEPKDNYQVLMGTLFRRGEEGATIIHVGRLFPTDSRPLCGSTRGEGGFVVSSPQELVGRRERVCEACRIRYERRGLLRVVK